MEILNRLLEISIYSAVLFFAIIALKKVLKKKMSPVLHFMIWFILVARLCLPVTIDSSIKLIVVPDQVPVQLSGMQDTALTQDSLYSIPSGMEGSTYTTDNASHMQQTNTVDNTSFSATEKVSRNIFRQIVSMKWTDIIIAVWIFGILVRMVLMTVSAAKMNRVIAKRGLGPPSRMNEALKECKAELGIKKDISLFILPNITTPALTIGFKPKIIIPDDMAQTMSDEEIAFAVKHELMHYKRKDHLTSIILRVLEAVYWFNPIIWLMNKCVIADMETACDSMVIKTLDKRGRKQYVLTLLNMFSQKKSPQFLLGMALGSSCKIAEKRIRGVYMKNKSGRSVKVIAAVLSAVLLVCCFTTACQPTPEKEAVVGKADGLPSQALNKEIDENLLPDVPEKWSDTLELNDNCKITIDAEIELPDTNVFPVYRLERNELTQERLNELINYFVSNGKFYEHGVFTKEYYEQRLIEAKRGQFVDGEYVPPPADDPWVKSIEQKLANAPSANEVTPAGTDFDYYSDYDGNIDESRGKNFLDINFTMEDGRSGSIFAMRYKMGNAVDNRFGLNTNINWMTQTMMENQPEISEDDRQYYTSEELAANDETNQILEGGFFDNFTLTQEQAINQANKVIADLGIDSMGIVHVEKVLIKRYSGMAGFSDVAAQEQGYVIDYARRLDAIDGFINNSMSNPEGDDKQDAYAPPFAMETITIVISESGIDYFGWGEMAKHTETVSENSELLPFEEIKERIVNQLKYENIVDAGSDMSIEIKIEEVRLLSGYINVKDDLDSVWHIPVWVAQGSMICTRENGESEEYGLGSTVINALDGGRVLGQDGSRYTS